MAVAVQSPASRAIDHVGYDLASAGIPATRDTGAFHPQTVGVLVGLPTLVGRGMATRRYELPVHVVSGDALITELAVDRLYALADDCALALHTDNYRPTEWRASSNAEPLPALELTVTVTVTELEE